MTAVQNGRQVFRIAIGQRVHISGWSAILLAPLTIPVALLIELAERLIGLKVTADLAARDVATYLRNFLEGTGDNWDWDDFTSIPIADPTLDSVRQEAASLPLPLDTQG